MKRLTQTKKRIFDENNERTKHVSVLNLILPLVCIVIALLATGLNCFTAFAIAVIFTGFLYVMQGLQTISEYVQCIVDGFIDMVDMVIILMLGYAMRGMYVCDGNGRFCIRCLRGNSGCQSSAVYFLRIL